MKKQNQIIKYEGTNEELYCKMSLDDCSLDTKIIVPETHNAVFLKDGILMNVLQSGAYPAFETEKRGLFAKKTSTSCTVDVIYLSKTARLKVLWGTKQPFKTHDPLTDLVVTVGCGGEFEVQIGNPRKAYLELIGAMKNFSLQELKERLAGRMVVYIEDAIARAMREKEISYDRFSEHKIAIGESIKETVGKIFEDDYGLKLFSFTLARVVISEEDIEAIKQFKEEQKEQQKQLEEEAKQKQLAEEERARQEMDEDKRRREEERLDDKDWERQKWLLELKSKDYEKYLEVVKALGVDPLAGSANGGNTASTKKAYAYCPKCGNSLDISDAFCPNCGAPTKETKATCPKCGKEVASGAKFCSGCGNAL